VKIGLVLPMATGDVERILGFARRAEDLGFDGLFAFDHLFPPGAPSDRPSLEAYATLAAVAAATTRVAVGSLVTRASLRRAGVLAWQASTLDGVSRGRFVLGIGAGDEISHAEHRAFGLRILGPTDRRAHLIETVRAVRALFEGRTWAGGEHVPPLDGPLLPPPRTPGGPPVWVGGASRPAALIAAREADGWNGWGLSTAVFADRVRVLREGSGGRPVEATWGGAAVLGRDRGEMLSIVQDRRARGLGHAWAGTAAEAVAWLARLRRAGSSWAILLAAGPRDRPELIAERVLPAVRGSG
jgi:alkanesulfonate monooxygenase SsuD/methylene tetrahydromethanopterin reductase-like flavin-dependent oxidoreductase (luciferase family)